jgi:hypothetical protein
MRGAVVDEAALTITLANGSRIVGLAPTSGNLRGRGKGVFCVWIDEAGFCAESLIRDARYLILDHLEEGAQL